MQKSKLMCALAAIVLLNVGAVSSSYAADAGKPMAGATASVSDEVIASSAKLALSSDKEISGLPVSVTSKKGVVVVTGAVPNAQTGDRVIHILASLEGVKDVKSELKVQAP